MGVSRSKAWEYAEGILDVPRGRVPITLRHGKTGAVLLHRGRVLTRCYTSTVGQWGAKFMAQALGVELPEQGQSVKLTASTGVLFRAISISSLDLRKPASYAILERMLEEAELQRGGPPRTHPKVGA